MLFLFLQLALISFTLDRLLGCLLSVGLSQLSLTISLTHDLIARLSFRVKDRSTVLPIHDLLLFHHLLLLERGCAQTLESFVGFGDSREHLNAHVERFNLEGGEATLHHNLYLVFLFLSRHDQTCWDRHMV